MCPAGTPREEFGKLDGCQGIHAGRLGDPRTLMPAPDAGTWRMQ